MDLYSKRFFVPSSSNTKPDTRNLRQFQHHLSNEVMRRSSANLLPGSRLTNVGELKVKNHLERKSVELTEKQHQHQIHHLNEKAKLTDTSQFTTNNASGAKNIPPVVSSIETIKIQKTGEHLEHLLDEINGIQNEVEIAQFKYHGERNLWAFANADLQRQVSELMNHLNKQEDDARKLVELETEVSTLRIENSRFVQQQKHTKNQQVTIEDLCDELLSVRLQLEALQKRYNEERNIWTESNAQLEIQVHKLRIENAAKKEKQNDQVNTTEMFDETFKKVQVSNSQQAAQKNQNADFEDEFSRLFIPKSQDEQKKHTVEEELTKVNKQLQDKEKELQNVKNQFQEVNRKSKINNETESENVKALQLKLNEACEENMKLKHEVETAHQDVARVEKELTQNKKEIRDFVEKLRNQSKEISNQEKELVELRNNADQAELEKQAVKDELDNVRKDLNKKIKENKNNQRDLQKKLDAIRKKLRQGEESYHDFSKHLDEIVHEATTD